MGVPINGPSLFTFGLTVIFRKADSQLFSSAQYLRGNVEVSIPVLTKVDKLVIKSSKVGPILVTVQESQFGPLLTKT